MLPSIPSWGSMSEEAPGGGAPGLSPGRLPLDAGACQNIFQIAPPLGRFELDELIRENGGGVSHATRAQCNFRGPGSTCPWPRASPMRQALISSQAPAPQRHVAVVARVAHASIHSVSGIRERRSAGGRRSGTFPGPPPTRFLGVPDHFPDCAAPRRFRTRRAHRRKRRGGF